MTIVSQLFNNVRNPVLTRHVRMQITSAQTQLKPQLLATLISMYMMSANHQKIPTHLLLIRRICKIQM